MVKSWLRVLATTVAISAAFAYPTTNVKAQNITLDGSLGSKETLTGPNYSIPQSVGQTAGNNLFHSFGKFNLDANEAAIFQSADNIRNILSRVTGGSGSSIDGLIRTLGNEVNFFLINPSGIVFGENARLDVSGSFVASTADSFVLGDGIEFSATNPQAVPLLKINVTPGLQYGKNQPSRTIINNANLAAGQDLKLYAGNLDLQGQLQAGRDLSLEANTVKVRDGIANPFMAVAGNKLSVLGRESVNIFALNHPNSGWFSAGDMILRSANTVSGDAHFHSGGSFRIENLDGSLGSLDSPYDPVIRVSGDVSFDSYTGASLHIFAGGSVNIPGVISITGMDTGENSIRERVRLSDGKTVVNIDGSSTPTLDIRAGTTAFEKPGIVGSSDGFSTVPTTVDNGITADINIGSIFVQATDGLVFLSNRYQPDESKRSGFIKVNNIVTNDFVFPGNAGSVIVDSRGDINFRRINSSSSSRNAGNVNLIANNSIQLQRSSIDSSSSSRKPGNINLIANNSIQLQRSLIFSATLDGKDNGGDISIRVPQLKLKGSSVIAASTTSRSSGDAGNINIDVERLTSDEGSDIISSSNGSGKGGDITVNATDLVELIGFSRAGGSGISSQTTGIDDGGNININTNKFIVRDGGGISVTTFGQGNAGNINITAKSVEMSNRGGNNIPPGFFVRNPSVTSIPTGLFAQVAPISTGNAGNLKIDTEKLVITDGAQVRTFTFGKGNGGEINIKAKEIELIGTLAAFPPTTLSSATASTGNAGKLTIETERLLVSDRARLENATRGLGKGANLTVNATEIVQVSNGGIISSASERTGDAGDLSINAAVLRILNGGQVFSGSLRSGKGGLLTVNASNLVEISGTNAEGVRSFLATATVGTGDAGEMRVITPTLLIKDGGRISAATDGNTTGNGNDINIEADIISLSNQAQVLASTTSQGNAGNIRITGNVFKADNGSTLRTTTNGKSKAGDITLNIKDNITLTGSETGIFADTTENSTGRGGSIIIDPEIVNIKSGARIAVDSQGSGEGGNIKLAAVYLNLDNGTISAETQNNTGGDIDLNIQDLLLLRNNSKISTTAGNQQFGGDGGNISIDTPNGFVVALPNENSDITANAFSGSGGKVSINATSILGIAPLNRNQLIEGLLTDNPEQLDPNNLLSSDITAISQQNPNLNGDFTITTPDVDPARGLIELPTNPVDVSQQIVQGCTSRGRENASTFIATGRGGLPLSPNQPLRGRAVITNWVMLPDESNGQTREIKQERTTKPTPETIVEAQGWIVNSRGEVELVAEVAYDNSNTSSVQSNFNCQVRSISP